jgi:hypothetical protein
LVLPLWLWDGTSCGDGSVGVLYGLFFFGLLDLELRFTGELLPSIPPPVLTSIPLVIPSVIPSVGELGKVPFSAVWIYFAYGSSPPLKPVRRYPSLLGRTVTAFFPEVSTAP